VDVGRHVRRECRREIAIDLHCDNARNPRRQRTCQRSAPGANLQKRVAGRRGDRGDQLRDPG
jgi:hypothetical protein